MLLLLYPAAIERELISLINSYTASLEQKIISAQYNWILIFGAFLLFHGVR